MTVYEAGCLSWFGEVSSGRNDAGVHIVVANNMHHGSCGRLPFTSLLSPCKRQP